MELIGLLIGAPIALVTSTIYVGLALASFARWPTLKRIAVSVSFFVVGLLAVEVLLLLFLGPKSAFGHLRHAYTVLHFVVLLLAPPAVANLVLHLTATKETARWFRFTASAACCWATCMGVVVGNILIDEAIVGVDAPNPFYLSRYESNQPPEPTAWAVTICADAQLAPAHAVAHL